VHLIILQTEEYCLTAKILEPGKSICANAAILLSRVLYTKTGGTKKFIIVDAGMNDLSFRLTEAKLCKCPAPKSWT